MTAPAACVIGWPVKHSRSPAIHGHWLRTLGIEGHYGIEEIHPDGARDFLSDIAAHGYVGLNATMPHKDIAFEMSEPDERARAVGAANTLWLEGGTLRSTNTDVEGFIGGLDWRAPGWDGRTQKAVILGAGGAARAIAVGLMERGIPEICVVNRTLSKAEALAERLGGSLRSYSMEQAHEALEGAGLLVNSTALGMEGQAPLEIDISALSDAAVVSDIVYVPLKTPLLADAEQRGHPTSNGLDMLLHQAVRGFELWFGRRPEVTQDLYDMIAADLSI